MPEPVYIMRLLTTRSDAQHLAAELLELAPRLPAAPPLQPGLYAASCPVCRSTWQIERATLEPHTLCCPKCGAVSQIVLRPIGGNQA